jgi:hypothetical protein
MGASASGKINRFRLFLSPGPLLTAPAPSAASTAHLSEAAARRVLMLQAFETAGTDSPLWTAEDRAWATRLARETGAAEKRPAAALDARATHAMQRLAPRDATVAKRLGLRMWNSALVPLVLVLAFIVGIAVDAIGGTQRINLLAPPVWAVIVWNLIVYLGLLLPKPEVPRGLRALLARRLVGGSGGHAVLRSYGVAWVQASLPLAASRAAVLLHAAAAALAIGLVAGLYGRGLVLDYRAGWESTFLDASAVRTGLAALLSPATAVTGIAVPDVAAVEALRVGAGDGLTAGATASAAPWIHLYAAMLGLFVIAPRALLALLAAMQAGVRARRVALPLDAPYFQRLLRELHNATPVVQVLPLGAAPSAQAMLALRDWLGRACGDGLQLRLTEATPYGQEDPASLPAPEPGTTLRVVLVDLGSTPEDDTQGRFLAACKAQTPLQLLVLADEAAFRSRFGQMPQRMSERRAAWQDFARAQGAAFVGIDLSQPDLATAEASLQAALAS